MTARVLQRFYGTPRRLRVAMNALCGGLGIARRVVRGGIALLALAGGQRQLLAQLAPLAVQRAALDFERPRGFCTALQRFLQFAHRESLRGETATDVVLVAGPCSQRAVHGGEIVLGGGALGGRRVMLALGLCRAPFSLQPFISGSLAPLARVAQPLRGEGEVALELAPFELRVAQPARDFGAPRFRRVPGLDPRFPVMLGIVETRAGRG